MLRPHAVLRRIHHTGLWPPCGCGRLQLAGVEALVCTGLGPVATYHALIRCCRGASGPRFSAVRVADRCSDGSQGVGGWEAGGAGGGVEAGERTDGQSGGEADDDTGGGDEGLVGCQYANTLLGQASTRSSGDSAVLVDQPADGTSVVDSVGHVDDLARVVQGRVK